MEKGIYKLHFDCGRMGQLDGIFIAPKEHVKVLIEEKIQVYFGEVLGKHSEIHGPIEEKDITFISDNPEAIKIIEELELETGYNPFGYSAYDHEYEGIEDQELIVSELIDQIIILKKNAK